MESLRTCCCSEQYVVTICIGRCFVDSKINNSKMNIVPPDALVIPICNFSLIYVDGVIKKIQLEFYELETVFGLCAKTTNRLGE